MRIMIDVTRSPHTGIGRYSWGLLKKLSQHDKNNSYCGLVSHGWEAYRKLLNLKLPHIFEIEKQPETIIEINEFSREIEKRADLFIATNFSTYHLIKDIPVIQVVHDIIHVLHPEWQPTLTDLFNKFGKTKVQSVIEDVMPIMEDNLKKFDEKIPISNVAVSPKETLVSRIYQTVFSYYIHNAAGIITVSNSVGTQIYHYYSQLPKTITIRHDLPSYLDINVPPKKDRDLQILYVANFEPRKNHGLLLKTLDILEKNKVNVKARLVGKPLYESYYRKYQQQYRRMRDFKNINIQSDLSDKQLSILYASSDVFVYPSIEEGFGIPLLEAMYTRTPSVVLDIPTSREICGDSALYVNQKDAKSMANNILTIYQNNQKRVEIIEKQSFRLKQYLLENNSANQVNSFLALVAPH